MCAVRTAILAAIAWICWATSTHADFVFSDFSSTAGLELNGDAAQVGNVLRLTPAATGQAGSAFTTSQTALGNLNSFSTFFSFQITGSGGISDADGIGADGIVFVIQTVSNNVGAAGGGIGYQGISPSIGIEFDTWNNGLNFGNNDPNGNHVGFDVNGDFGNPVIIEPTRFNNDQVWNAWIDYDGNTQVLEARWSMGGRPLLPQLSTTVDLLAVLGQDTAFLGFTSGTGSAFGNHDILSWVYRDSFNPIGTNAVPEASSILAWTITAGCFAGVLGRRRRKQKIDI
jgi:hypothetical protein